MTDTACFLTLTYDEEHCPLSLDKKELQKFWKRLRKAIAPRKIKYFACGEYGDTYGRPHYHAIVFGIDWHDEAIINDAWSLGFIKIGGVTVKSIGYVTDYCLKKYDKRRNKEEYEEKGLQRPFQLCSQGLGLRYALKHADQLRDELGTTIQGKRCGLPRYYVKKLDIDVDIMAEYAKSAQAEKLSLICRRLGVRDDDFSYNAFCRPCYTIPDYFQAYSMASRKQREINYDGRKRFKKGLF